MKKIVKHIQSITLLAGTAILLVSCGGQESTREETTTVTTRETTTDVDTMASTETGMAGSGMMGHMHKNMDEMRNMRSKMTGDPDYDFAQMMTHHHQGAIRMADEELKNGTDSKIKEMAQKIKDTNQTEIQKLQDFMGKHKPTSGDTARTMKMMHPMNSMMGKMHQKDMSSMNTDQNFAQMMIHHHQMGNEMSKEFQKAGKTQEMKQMAQKMITEQTKEIKELEAWQKQNQQ